MREVAEAEDGNEYETFNERLIARAPLAGQYYLADLRQVHNLLTGYMQGEQSESWIRSIARYQDGRRDMLALRRHYAGEGNSTRRIGDAKRIQSTLHYKSEHALAFNKFLDTLQKMFTIFEEENEPLSERAKVDELLTKVQSPTLSAAIAQLRFQLNTEGVTFTVAANHLNAAVSQTTDYQLARKIGATNTNERLHGGRGGRGNGRFNNRGGRGGGGRGRGGRLGSGGRGPPGQRGRGGGPSTNYYSPAEWNKLSFEERDKIRRERDKKGEQGGTKRSVGDLLVEQFTAMLSTVQQDAATVTTTDLTDTSNPGNNAGNAFGGKESAKRLKFS
jgi:outer membrane murein-binding lipoprotein Lpp